MKFLFLPLLAITAVAVEPRSSLRGRTAGPFPGNRKLDGEEFIIPEPEDQCVDPVYLNDNSAICCENPVIDHECLSSSTEANGQVEIITGPNADETSYFWINFDENQNNLTYPNFRTISKKRYKMKTPLCIIMSKTPFYSAE